MSNISAASRAASVRAAEAAAAAWHGDNLAAQQRQPGMALWRWRRITAARLA
jgi:hypothetical protein